VDGHRHRIPWILIALDGAGALLLAFGILVLAGLGPAHPLLADPLAGWALVVSGIGLMGAVLPFIIIRLTAAPAAPAAKTPVVAIRRGED
jgi:hypothetical protein